MVKRAASILKYSLSLVLAGALMYFAFRNVHFGDFMEKAKSVEYAWVIGSIILSIVAYYARAYRWNILIRPMGYQKLSIHRTTVAILVGYLANLALPRLGEITRCGMLKRSDDVPVSTSLGTVISERLIDVLTLLMLILFTLAIEHEKLVSFLEDLFTSFVDLEGLWWKLSIAGVVLLVLIGVGYVLIRRAGPKISQFVRELVEGIISLRKIDNWLGFVLSTLVLWVAYYYMSYIIVFALEETSHLDWAVGVMLLVTGGIALAIPVQGGFGTYHTLVSVMLSLYGIEMTTGVFLATLLHTSQVVAIALFGSIGVLISIFMNKSRKKEHQENERATL
ncbi:lysylphosphatidylglycerol synthase transmembrane domain-containing protein [Marinoscillum sp. MHG1-6]|uniref:lysylphosphatidylglycerol synthase transmembrane domain-containing protein n=1 Tax=Marinoscillum sp. MHG1-6 TaxID=2959627 RepID=UPI0021583FE4|nr:lysylphosphatidylglycerol synthase transmembrane domain-containing protein [Marinoscillum sp. MHG1-6]